MINNKNIMANNIDDNINDNIDDNILQMVLEESLKFNKNHNIVNYDVNYDVDFLQTTLKKLESYKKEFINNNVDNNPPKTELSREELRAIRLKKFMK
jgi:hypothetical protein